MAQAYGENLRQAMDTLRSHKLRSALTVFGVVLGVSVIMLVAALLTGFDQKIQESVNQYGADTAFITKWDQGRHGGPPPLEEQQRKPLTVDDAIAIQERCTAVRRVTVFLETNWQHNHVVRTKAGDVTAIDFRGVQPNFGEVTRTPQPSKAASSAKATIFTRKKSLCSAKMSLPSFSPKAIPSAKT